MEMVPTWRVIDVLVKCGLASSKTDARRVIRQGGVRVYEDDETWTMVPDETALLLSGTHVLRRGKRRWCRVTLDDVRSVALESARHVGRMAITAGTHDVSQHSAPMVSAIESGVVSASDVSDAISEAMCNMVVALSGGSACESD